MTNKLLFAASTLGGALGNFALTGEAHAGTFVCGAFQCEENSEIIEGGGIYESGAVCWVGSGQTGQVDVANLRSCVEGVTGKPSVTMHVRAQGASGRGQTTWNGGLAVTQFAFGSDPLFPQSGGILYYEVGRQPATAKQGDGWLLPRPHNASFVATTATPTLNTIVVLAGGGGSKGRENSGDGRWSTTSSNGGRGGWALGRKTSQPRCTTGGLVAVCVAGYPGGDDGPADGGDGGGDMTGGAGGDSQVSPNLPSETGWGEFYGLAAYGAQDGVNKYMLVGGEGGQGDGGGGGGGVFHTCGFSCNDGADTEAAAGGGGGSRAVRTSIQQTLPVFAKQARVELVFNHWSP